MIKSKSEWYKLKQADLKLSVDTERESKQLDKEALNREVLKINKQMESVESQTQYIRQEKDKVILQQQVKAEERQDVQDRVEELRQKKMKLLLERSRIEN